MTKPFNFTDQSRVMLIAPHPDDEILAAGGLLQEAVAAGAAVRVIFVTSGENNPWPQRVIEHRWRIGDTDRVRWGTKRRSETLAGLGSLGIQDSSVVFWGYPDQGLTKILLTKSEGLIAKLAAEIANWCPTLLVTPSALDLHPDHSALSVLLRFAISRLGNSQQQSITEISYLIHTRNPKLPDNNFLFLSLLPYQQASKRYAILCHSTQLRLSKRRFLMFAGDSEKFLLNTEPDSYNDSHPLRQAVFEDKVLRLKIAQHSRIGAFGETTLYILIESSEVGNRGYFMVLPRKSAEVNVHEATSGEVVAQGHFKGNRQQGEMLFTFASFSAIRRVFVKLERRFGFFDEAGWKEIPFPQKTADTAPSASDEKRKDFSFPKVCCVIPCYNVALYCGEVLRKAAMYTDYVIAVDDGSTDGTDKVLKKVETECKGKVEVISFENNCGKGSALIKGFNHALMNLSFDILVTMDADGQHRASDIPRLVNACINGHAVFAIGERTERFASVPLRSRLGNIIITSLTRRW